MDNEFLATKNMIDQLFAQATSKVRDLRSALNAAQVKPLLISKEDAINKGLRVFEDEGHVCFLFPFTLSVSAFLINNVQLWHLKKPITKELFCLLTTTVCGQVNQQNVFVPNFVLLYKDVLLRERAWHFHSLSTSDCSGTYRLPPFMSTAELWEIRSRLEKTWQKVSYPCPNLTPPDPDFKALGEQLFGGAERLTIVQLQERLKKVADLVESVPSGDIAWANS